MNTNGKSPVSPGYVNVCDGKIVPAHIEANNVDQLRSYGLTKKELFAMAAMQALLSNGLTRRISVKSKIAIFLGINKYKVDSDYNFKGVASSACEMADEFISALNKEVSNG